MTRPVRTLEWERFTADDPADVIVSRIPQDEGELHDHVFHEIVYIDSGTGDHITAEGRRRLSPGDLIVIRPQVWHGYDKTRNLTIFNCLFHKRLLQQFADVLKDVDGSFELFRKPARRPEHEAPVVLHARPGQRPAIVDRLERIMSEQRDRANGWRAAATAALLDILVVTARLRQEEFKESPVKLPGRSDQAVLDAVSYLETNFDQAVSLEELSRRVSLSPAHLSRSFTKRMGMGVIEFVHRLRCEEACRQLRGSNDSIGQIATRVGYDEIAYFSRCFRRQIGQSPREYRSASRSDMSDEAA